MNKLVRIFFIYSFFALTGIIITSILLFRNLTTSSNQTTQDIAKIKEEITGLQSSLASAKSSMRQIDIVKEMVASSEAKAEAKSVLGKSTESTLGYVSISDPNLKSIDTYEDKSFSSNVVGKLDSEKAYRYSKKEDGWYLVELTETKEGWVSVRFVKEIAEQP